MPHLKFIVAGSLIIGAVGYLMFTGISGSMVYYYSVPELLANPEKLAGKGIRVSGQVSPGSIQREPGNTQVHFTVFEPASRQTVAVVYQGIVPDTFKDNAEVVVEGTYEEQEQRFHATTLLAKCPSKYESQGDEHPEEMSVGQKAR
jgi:cytochrome c-type biogenesis protein CcmE